MTRKRFIKLAMARGVQKREAQKIALLYHAKNIPYEKAYRASILAGMARSFIRFGASCSEFSKSLLKLTQAIHKLGKELQEVEQN